MATVTVGTRTDASGVEYVDVQTLHDGAVDPAAWYRLPRALKDLTREPLACGQVWPSVHRAAEMLRRLGHTVLDADDYLPFKFEP